MSDTQQENQVVLKNLRVEDINGHFVIPSYQRGYRWTKTEIELLLEDLYSADDESKYCLQPVVVKPRGVDPIDGLPIYEVIDGQQRLTTIYLIARYIIDKNYRPMLELGFDINYEVRSRCTDFLQNMEESRFNENIDFYYLYKGYQIIDEWITNGRLVKEGVKKNSIVGRIVPTLFERENSAFVIWYQINEQREDPRELFARLNIGKIPLTNGELIKALLLSKENASESYSDMHVQQLTIAAEWDAIEKELHDSKLWYFLTNKSEDTYQTRIELIFDFMVKSKKLEHDKLATFFAFQKKLEDYKSKATASEPAIIHLWAEIKQYYNNLKYWYTDRELYHKIGFLVWTDQRIDEIQSFGANVTKTEFKNQIDAKIKKVFEKHTWQDVMDFEYDNSKKKEQQLIHRVLGLVNILSTCKMDNKHSYFPFDLLKSEEWSLEHIHAQHSQGLTTKEQWKTWVKEHMLIADQIIGNVEAKSKAIEKANSFIQLCEQEGGRSNSLKTQFDEIFSELIKMLGQHEGQSAKNKMHGLGNLTLLSRRDNSSLNNSVFELKRRKIAQMDSEGKFIPIVSKRVFFKQYTDSADTQVHYWSDRDAENYVDMIKNVVADYIN